MALDDKLESLFADLKQYRDELRVQMHLARSELRDEFEELESQWERLQPRLEKAAEDAAETGKEALDALEKAGSAILDGFRRIRDDLK